MIGKDIKDITRSGNRNRTEKVRREGKEEGKAEGEGKLLRLQKFLIDTGRSGELGLVITDQAYREQLYQTLIEGQCTQ